MPDIEIVEVSPRDGLQNEARLLLDRRQGRRSYDAASTPACAGSR